MPIYIVRQAARRFEYQRRERGKFLGEFNSNGIGIYGPFWPVDFQRSFQHDREIVGFANPQPNVIGQREGALVD